MPNSKAKTVELKNNRWKVVEKLPFRIWPRWESFTVEAGKNVYWKWYSDAFPFYLEGKFTKNNVKLFIPGGFYCVIHMRSEKDSKVIVY